jgi:hypothetical protein
MADYIIHSRCECQATLSATLNEAHHILTGSACRGGSRERAPAHSIGAYQDRFDIGWACPFCGRNTLRTFHIGALKPVADVPGDNSAPAASPA